MAPDKLRRSVLGALRYGKPLVLDLMDCAGLWGEMDGAFGAVQPGLLQAIMDRWGCLLLCWHCNLAINP
jgi:hypothetical protein